MPKPWPLFLLSALVLALLIGGLLTVGGPGAARTEQRDDQRYDELQQLSRHVQCLAEAQDPAIAPESLPVPPPGTSLCSAPLGEAARLTEEGFRYERVDEKTYRICATFEDIEQARERLNRASLVPDTLQDTGCLTGRIH